MRSHHGWRGYLVLAVLAVVVSAGPGVPQSRIEIGVFKLAPDSPLATDGSTVYAVADDGRTVLAGTSGRDWRVLLKGPTPHRINGLAFGRGALYLSDERAVAVYRLRLPSTGSPLRIRPDGATRAELIHQGPPLKQPGDLAYTNMLIVADRGAQAVFRVEPDKRVVEPLAQGLPPGRIHVGAERGEVVVTSPEAGEIRQPAPFGPYGGAPLSVWRTREQPGEPAGPAGSAPRRRVPLIQAPSAPSVLHGSLYVLDERTGGVFVSFRQQARPAKVPAATPVTRPTRLLALEELLLVLDGARGEVQFWPRAVPTQFDLGRRAGPAFDALLSVLLERRALPTRRAAWQRSLDETLSSAAVGAPSPAFKSLVCSLNAPACAGGSLPAGFAGEIVVPDVPIEGVIDLETISAEALGRRTLGEEVDGRVISSAFADHRQSQEIWELNASALTALAKESVRQTRPWGPFEASRMRELRGTDLPPQFLLTIPVERVRCVLALPPAMLHEESGLAKIRYLSPGFDWTPLEEIGAKAAGLQPPPPAASPSPPPPCDLALLRQRQQELRSAIHFKSPPGIGSVSVGVIEALIDFQHPTFGTASPAFAFLPGWGTPPPVGTGTGAPVCPPEPGRDHGTAVAGLIAGRDSGTGLSGLVPNVQMVPVRPTDADTGGDLFSAFRDRRVLIFNLSAHYEERIPLNIRRKISELQQALFVVAAGNDPTDGKPVCESDRPYPAYPVCEGYRNNVLVVAATNLAGDALIDKVDIPPTPGSNWNERLVHIAAPGIGYYAPGRDNSYVPVRGTSFATPLVTATAALLVAQGVKDPWLIKQRIIATADLRDNLRTKVFGAGLLNVGRAVTAPKHAVLVTTANQEKVVAMEPTDITIKWSTGARTLRVDDVRRLTKSQTGNSYRIVYLDEVTKLLVIQEDVEPGPWPFQYRNVDDAGNATGNTIADGLHNYKDYVGPLS